MSYFLWIEDFDGCEVKATASDVLSEITPDAVNCSDKEELKRYLKSENLFLELSLQDGLEFIKNRLEEIDYIILDINLVPYLEDDPINSCLKSILSEFHNYSAQENESLLKQRERIKALCSDAQLKENGGYYLFTQLIVEKGFPKQHILFCSNHGDTTTSIQDTFKSAKIALPPIYKKSDKEVNEWVKSCYENPYSRLRRGIIEGCKYLKDYLENLPEEKLNFNNFIKNTEKQVNLADMHDYLDVLENFLPLREPSDKAALYKLFIRTLAHEWEAADFIKGEAWIMKCTRNWITHNSTLFNELDEKILAYLFIINMRVMFSFDEVAQPYEEILLDLFKEDDLSVAIFKNQIADQLFPLSKAYLDLKNLVLNERKNKNNNVHDGFYFNELANNLQQSNSSLKNDKQLFSKLLYQMFWLTTSNPFISTGYKRNLLEIKFWDFNYAEKPYLFELARHIYSRSFS
ncbi:MAG: hypothetical protein WCS87_11435 [Methylococcaceae bacterium]